MSCTFFGRWGLSVLLGLVSPAVLAADPQALLARMQRAAQSLSYDGTFVYQHGDQLDSLRILHQAGQGGARERLVSLNGAPREVIRNHREVLCYLPDDHVVTIEHRRADNRNFPALLPESLGTLERSYLVKAGKDGRVAGRKARSVLIKPRDAYRYGYQLWADEATGLLLKASLFDEQGSVIEQYMFTQVTIGKAIAEADLAPQFQARTVVRQRVEEPPAAPGTGQWAPARVPAGFALSARVIRQLPARRQPVEHLVYSDGLSVVSVFVEPLAGEDGAAVVSGLTRMGAVHAYGKVVDGHRVTVVGEVPAATVDMIAESVTRQR
jgi:sigma-E factor negative regulatory protein RseB